MQTENRLIGVGAEAEGCWSGSYRLSVDPKPLPSDLARPVKAKRRKTSKTKLDNKDQRGTLMLPSAQDSAPINGL